MGIEIGKNWPLTVVNVSEGSALQNKSVTDLVSQPSQDSAILDIKAELEPAPFWEKGTFIDIYV